MTSEDVAHIRKLDVPWARGKMKSITGCVIHDARSERTGQCMTADEVALMALHQLRTRFGNGAEAKASRRWLRERNFEGLFGAPVDLN